MTLNKKEAPSEGVSFLRYKHISNDDEAISNGETKKLFGIIDAVRMER